MRDGFVQVLPLPRRRMAQGPGGSHRERVPGHASGEVLELKFIARRTGAATDL
jgi:hypothetical protein